MTSVSYAVAEEKPMAVMLAMPGEDLLPLFRKEAEGSDAQARAVLIPNAQERTMKPIIEGWIDPTSALITDKNPSYGKIGVSFASHHTIQHNKRQYANTKTGAHINTVEAVNAVV